MAKLKRRASDNTAKNWEAHTPSMLQVMKPFFWPLIANEYRYIAYKFEIRWTLFTGSKNQSPTTNSFVRT